MDECSPIVMSVSAGYGSDPALRDRQVHDCLYSWTLDATQGPSQPHFCISADFGVFRKSGTHTKSSTDNRLRLYTRPRDAHRHQQSLVHSSGSRNLTGRPRAQPYRKNTNILHEGVFRFFILVTRYTYRIDHTDGETAQLRAFRLLESCRDRDVRTETSLKPRSKKSTYPFETLVQTVTAGSTCGLNVPLPVSQRVETQSVGKIGSLHSVGQIL